jgi:hypothetical protein
MNIAHLLLVGLKWCAWPMLCQVGGGYNQSKSSSQSWYPLAKPLINQFIPVGAQLLSESNPQGGPGVAAGNQVLMDNASGMYTNPASDPALAPAAAAITDQASQFLQQNLAQEDSAANQGGMLLSTKNAQQKDYTTEQAQQNVTDQLSGLYQGEYDTERADQNASANSLISNGNFDWNQALQLLSLFGGMGKSGSSSMGVSLSA